MAITNLPTAPSRGTVAQNIHRERSEVFFDSFPTLRTELNSVSTSIVNSENYIAQVASGFSGKVFTIGDDYTLGDTVFYEEAVYRAKSNISDAQVTPDSTEVWECINIAPLNTGDIVISTKTKNTPEYLECNGNIIDTTVYNNIIGKGVINYPNDEQINYIEGINGQNTSNNNVFISNDGMYMMYSSDNDQSRNYLARGADGKFHTVATHYSPNHFYKERFGIRKVLDDSFFYCPDDGSYRGVIVHGNGTQRWSYLGDASSSQWYSRSGKKSFAISNQEHPWTTSATCYLYVLGDDMVTYPSIILSGVAKQPFAFSGDGNYVMYTNSSTNYPSVVRINGDRTYQILQVNRTVSTNNKTCSFNNDGSILVIGNEFYKRTNDVYSLVFTGNANINGGAYLAGWSPNGEYYAHGGNSLYLYRYYNDTFTYLTAQSVGVGSFDEYTLVNTEIMWKSDSSGLYARNSAGVPYYVSLNGTSVTTSQISTGTASGSTVTAAHDKVGNYLFLDAHNATYTSLLLAIQNNMVVNIDGIHSVIDYVYNNNNAASVYTRCQAKIGKNFMIQHITVNHYTLLIDSYNTSTKKFTRVSFDNVYKPATYEMDVKGDVIAYVYNNRIYVSVFDSNTNTMSMTNVFIGYVGADGITSIFGNNTIRYITANKYLFKWIGTGAGQAISFNVAPTTNIIGVSNEGSLAVCSDGKIYTISGTSATLLPSYTPFGTNVSKIHFSSGRNIVIVATISGSGYLYSSYTYTSSGIFTLIDSITTANAQAASHFGDKIFTVNTTAAYSNSCDIYIVYDGKFLFVETKLNVDNDGININDDDSMVVYSQVMLTYNGATPWGNIPAYYSTVKRYNTKAVLPKITLNNAKAYIKSGE